MNGTFDFISFFFFWLHLASFRVFILLPVIEPAPPAVQARSSGHRTTREVPDFILFYCSSIFLCFCSFEQVFIPFPLLPCYCESSINTILLHSFDSIFLSSTDNQICISLPLFENIPIISFINVFYFLSVSPQ